MKTVELMNIVLKIKIDKFKKKYKLDKMQKDKTDLNFQQMEKINSVNNCCKNCSYSLKLKIK